MSHENEITDAEVTEAAEVTENEAPAATDAAEASTTEVTEAAEAPAAPAGPTTEEINAALDEFHGLVLAILGTPPGVEGGVKGRIDEHTGDLTSEDMASLVTAYKALPGTARVGKRAVEKLTETQMEALTQHIWATGARALALIINALRDADKGARHRAEAVARPTVDPTTAHVALAAAHVLSVNFLPVGSDVDESWGARVNETVTSLRDEVATYMEYLTQKAAYDALDDEAKAATEEPTVPEVDAIVIQAARLARGRAAGTKRASAPREPKSGSAAVTPRGDGPRGVILDHILEVFADQPVGTFLKVAQIAKTKTSQYPDGNASGGAVSQRIKSDKWSDLAPSLQFTNDGSGMGLTRVA